MPLNLFCSRVGEHTLAEPDRQALAKAVVGRRQYRARDCIVEEGECPEHLHLVTNGWAVEYRSVSDGSSHITNFNLPGDLCDVSALAPRACDRVTALTQVETALLDRSVLRETMAANPKIAHAILRVALGNQSVLRTWVVCFGLRDRRQHLAHLICELHSRMRRAGLAGDHAFDLPMAQADLADAAGMSIVHLNRVLKALKQENVVRPDRRHIRILNPARLRDIAEYDDDYLRL